ncbi:ead/Ea22-like family protein [Escherichia coli]|uniref:ead/Ea22-like family protein n=1 Tax=Escherichia coli TaxID=562 RepID=UPI003F5472A1
MTNKQALRDAANAANIASWGRWESYHPHKGARGYEVKVGVKAIAQHCLKVDSVFIAAANPATVLALLDELEFLDKRNAELNSTLERWAVDRAQSASELDDAEKRIAELEGIATSPRPYQVEPGRWGCPTCHYQGHESAVYAALCVFCSNKYKGED